MTGTRAKGKQHTVVMMRKMAKSSERRSDVSWSTPTMMPLSMSTAASAARRVRAQLDRSTQGRRRRTKRIKVKRHGDALLHGLVRVPLRVNPHLFNGERVEPHAHLGAVPRPQRVLERVDPAQVRPIELDAVGQDLQVVLNFFVRGAARAEEDEAA